MHVSTLSMLTGETHASINCPKQMPRKTNPAPAPAQDRTRGELEKALNETEVLENLNEVARAPHLFECLSSMHAACWPLSLHIFDPAPVPLSAGRPPPWPPPNLNPHERL